MRISSLAGVLGLVAWLVASPAAAGIDKCQLGIDKAGAKLEGSLLKALQKCTDFYRKAAVKNTAIGGADGAAGHCQLQLQKAIKFPDASVPGSAMAATKKALDALLTLGTCTDDDLETLGHLRTAVFGDRWSRWVLIAKLRSAYDAQLALTRDTVGIFRALDAAGGCPLCTGLASPPCATHTCRLGSTGTSNALIYVLTGPATTTVPLSGETSLELCQNDDVLPGDLAVIGNPSKTIKPTTIFGLHVCTTTGGAEGYVNCSSTAPRVNYTTCQDHVVNAPEVDDCAAAGFTTCAPTTPDLIDGDPSGGANTHTATTNGGRCLRLSSVAAATGDAFVLATTQITLVTAAQLGADGVACTSDDTAPPGIPSVVPLTTGTAQATVFDAGNTPGTNVSTPVVTGARFNCSNIQSGNLSPGKLVGAFPAIHSLCLVPPCDDPLTVADEGTIPIDSAVTFTLACQ